MENLSKECKKAEFDEMADEAEDINSQPWLIAKCKSDLKKLCNLELPEEPKISASTKPDEGKAKECLKEKLDKKVLDPECKKAVEDQVKFESQDIRINHKVFKLCTPTIQQFCKELPSEVAKP